VKTDAPPRAPTLPTLWPLAAALAAVWWLSIRMLWTSWEIDPQYSYGFLVPILCVALFLQRWRDRPAPEPAPRLLPHALLAMPMLGFLAGIQVFFEANPEWRIPGVLGAFCAVGATLLLLHALGGGPWVRHFLFPVAFFLIAVPWPRNAEESLMGFLMEKNAIAALEVLHWCGYEAIRRGHLIALPTGMIGVEEACSGVRSLQSGLMASLFFGEIFRFGLFARSALVLAAFSIAIAGNFLRATALSILASHEGPAAVNAWHDTAGFVILGTTLGGLWLLAVAWQKWRTRKAKSAPLPHPVEPAWSIPPALRAASLAIALLAILALGGTEAWYRLHERDAPPPSEWTVQSGLPGTKPVQIADRTRRILFFPEGFSERFRDDDGRNWQFFYFRWPAGRSAVQAIDIHDPRTCLGSLGMELVRQLPSIEIRSGGVSLPFRVFQFSDHGRPLVVFHSIIADRPAGSEDTEMDQSPASGPGARWQAVVNGQRNPGQRLLEAAVWDTEDAAQATTMLQAFLERAILPATRP
jgi:exosortase